MKKLIALSIAAAAALTIAGCSSHDSTTSSSNSASGGKVISLITQSLDNPFWATEAKDVTAEGESLGYKVNVTAHEQDPKKQSDLIDAAISNKSAAIILDNAGADSSIGDVKRATAAGIPVFLLNAEINAEGIAKVQLVSNNAQGAALGGQAFADAMMSKGKYVELLGNMTNTNGVVRSDGYASVLSQYPDLHLLQQETANWDQKQGYDKTQLLLQAHPDLQGIIAGNDEMALGAVAALKQAGRTDVVVGGFDGTPDAAAAVKAGTMRYSVVQPIPEMSRRAVQIADQFIRTGNTGLQSEKIALDCTLLDKNNVGTYSDFGFTK